MCEVLKKITEAIKRRISLTKNEPRNPADDFIPISMLASRNHPPITEAPHLTGEQQMTIDTG